MGRIFRPRVAVLTTILCFLAGSSLALRARVAIGQPPLGEEELVLRDSDPAELNAFLTEYCLDCHGAETQEADRRFDRLLDADSFADQSEAWHEILDRLNLGDMPPEDAERPLSDAQRIAIVRQLSRRLTEASAHGKRAAPTVFRRLNRTEYDAAMRSVFGLTEMLDDPTADFMPDESTHHFRNIGDTLVLSDFLLRKYLNASEKYLDHAATLAAQPPETQHFEFQAPFCRSRPNPDGQDRPGKYQHLRENSTDQFGYLWLSKWRSGAPADGRYRIRVKAAAIDRDYPYRESIIHVPREDPLQLSIVAADTRAGDMATNNSTDRVLATMDVADDQPQWYETTAWLDRHYQPRFGFPNGPAKIKYMRHRLMHEHRELFPRFLRDHVHVFHSMHPDYDRKTAPAMVEAFLAEQERLKNAGKRYDVFGIDHRLHTDDAWIQFYSEYRGPRIRVYEVEIEGPLPDQGERSLARQFFPASLVDDRQMETLLVQLARRAYRGNATAESVEPILSLVRSAREQGRSRPEALRLGYQAVLCSPKFLYHRTRPGPLNQHELANRLAFFLWSMPPDQTLRSLAAEGRLSDPVVLQQQTERLLNDRKSERMVAAFTDAWLQLSKLGTMLPDRTEHPDYFNQRLESYMRDETRAFVSDAIRNDAGVSVLIDSDYAFWNASLARLYGHSEVEGHQLRRVTLDDRRRGGLLGQASVLTASANGIDTSPVLRGMWVLESLLGTPPPPPPPDVEPLEPDVRGATTIRDQLAKHRTVVTCNHCHRRIDPPGFALECFDEIGRLRTHYSNPEKRGKPGAPIDPSGKLPSGESFQDVAQLKSLLMKRIDLVAQNLAGKLLTHATGRIDDPNDRVDMLGVLQRLPSQAADPSDRLSPHGVGIRSLIHAVVASDSFAR